MLKATLLLKDTCREMRFDPLPADKLHVDH
jgi:hypothetical protein